LQALLSTGTGQDFEIPSGLLYAISGGKLGHQIIVYYTGGQFHSRFSIGFGGVKLHEVPTKTIEIRCLSIFSVETS